MYVDRTKGCQLKVMLPHSHAKSLIYQKIKALFTSNLDFLTLYNKINCLKVKFNPKQFRISKHIEDLLEKTKILEEKQQIKLQILNGAIKPILKQPLYPYQQQGMLHLVEKARALLADEMGLGKTIQAIAACVLLAQLGKVKKVLVVTTSSVKLEWLDQIQKFTEQKGIVIQGDRESRSKQYQSQAMFYLANYEQVVIDGPWLQILLNPEVIILDEAQKLA